MPVPTPAEFWQLLVACRLFDAAAIDALRGEYAAHLAAEGGDDSGRSIAVWLLARGAITRWQAKRLAIGDKGPFVLGDYRLLERHEHDGEALLFTSRHEPSGRIVELVLLNAKRCRQLDVWTEIVKRTTTTNQTSDPMLGRLWSLEQHEAGRFIICEHVAGMNLADEVERFGKLPVQQAGVLVWQMAKAVAEIHSLGAVHGGLSLDALRREPAPGGIERTGRVRLLQFPLVYDPHLVPLRPLVGTDAEVARLARRSAFIAPELLVPGAVCDMRSDVYALGAVYYALLAGHGPCWQGAPQETLRQASFVGPAPLPDDVPGEIATLVGYMMARDPTERYETAAEVANAIATCLGIAAPPVAMPVAAAAGGHAAVETPDFPTASAPATVRGGAVAAERRPAGLPSAAEVARQRAKRLRMMGGLIVGLILAASVGLVAYRINAAKKPRPRAAELASRPGAAREARPRATPSPAPTPPAVVEPAPAAPAVTVAGGESPSKPTPSTAATAGGKEATPPKQVVVDDPTLPWASPTSGPPPTLAYLAPGSQLILVARLADVATDSEGTLFLKSLGPTAEQAVATLVTLAGGDIEAVETVQAGWQAGGPDEVIGAYAVRFVEGRGAPADDESRREAWGRTSKLKIGDEIVHQTDTLSLWVPSVEKGRVLVIAPNVEVSQDASLSLKGGESAKEPLIARIVRDGLVAAADGGPLQAALPGDMERLVGMLDATRHVTLLGSPHYLLNTGRPVLAGPLAKLADPIDGLFGEAVQAAALSLHFGDSLYVEMDAVATLDVAADGLATEIASRIDGLADMVERYCTDLNPAPYGRVLVMRLPGMIRALSAQVRAGAEGKGIVVNAYLPKHAAHNVALAAEIALAQAPGGGVAVAAAAPPPATPKTALEKLAKKLTLTFAKDNLERSIQMVSDETGVPMEILGGDLQLEGITKNQSFGLDEKNKTADEILRVILAKSNPDGKLVYVVKEKDGEEWVYITTRAAVEKRGDKLPPAFAPTK